MKNHLVLIFLLVTFQLSSQSNCIQTPEESQIVNEYEYEGMNCIDIEEIMINCDPVYLNVNVHFFLDDNCEGDIAANPNVVANLEAYNAFNLAEQMIDDANSFFETVSANSNGENYQWHSDDHGLAAGQPQCIPIRYVLNGVEVHCSSNDQNWPVSRSTFETNETTEMNIFVSNIPSGTEGFGYNADNQFIIENFSPGLFNLEAGHALNLGHPHDGNDNCNDTWDNSWTWDHDGDGIIDFQDDSCWDHTDVDPVNGMDPCDTNHFNPVHPCCIWSNQSNNLMTYSTWGNNPIYSTLTECQVMRALEDIDMNMCDYVNENTGGCPPPSAVIGVLPSFSNGIVSYEDNCPSCFYFNASDNEESYSFNISDSFGNVIIESGEKNGDAGKYCITPFYDIYGVSHWPSEFQEGVEYTITLNVESACQKVDSDSFTFTLPPPCTMNNTGLPDGFYLAGFSPNPTSTVVNLTVNHISHGSLNIYGIHNNSGYSYGLLNQITLIPNQVSNIQINVSNWLQGNNTIILTSEHHTIAQSLIKI